MLEDPTESDLTVGDIPNAPDGIPPAGVTSQQTIQSLNKKVGDLSAQSDLQRTKIRDLKSAAKTKDLLDSLIIPSSKNAFRFMCIYCAVVGVILLLDAWSYKSFDLPDSTLNFLVGSTATTVIGLVGMVLTGVFLGARK